VPHRPPTSWRGDVFPRVPGADLRADVAWLAAAAPAASISCCMRAKLRLPSAWREFARRSLWQLLVPSGTAFRGGNTTPIRERFQCATAGWCTQIVLTVIGLAAWADIHVDF